MSEAVDLDILFSPSAETGVDALLAEFTQEADEATAAQKKPKDAPLSRKKQRPPSWFIPLPPKGFKFISKSNLSALMRDKMGLIQKHATLTDHFYFNHWVSRSKTRQNQYNTHRLASMAKISRTALAQIAAQAAADEQNLGLDLIQEHIEHREEELQEEQKEQDEKKNQHEDGDDGKDGDDKEQKKLKVLGRLIKHSTRHGRGITSWGHQKDETLADTPDILPENAPQRQMGLFDQDQNAVSRRFVEQGFESVIRAHDDLIMLKSLPKLPVIPPSDVNTSYRLRVDTQDIQMSDIVQFRNEQQQQIHQDSQNPYLMDMNGGQQLGQLPQFGGQFGDIQSNNQEFQQMLQQQQQPQQQQQSQSQQSPQRIHTSSIQTEEITYAQLLTLHTKLRDSLHRCMDELFELLDIQYTLQHVFSTSNNLLTTTPQSFELLTLTPIQDIAIQYQLPLTTPLNQLPLLLPHLQIDIVSVIDVLDTSRWTIFTGFDDRFLKLMLPVPRTLLLFSKAIQVAKEGQLPHLNRLIGFVLELLPEFMSIDRVAMNSHLASVPVSQTSYKLQPPPPKKITTNKKTSSSPKTSNPESTTTATTTSTTTTTTTPEVENNSATTPTTTTTTTTGEEIGDAKVEDTPETQLVQPVPIAPQDQTIAVPFSLFNSPYLPYIRPINAKPISIKTTVTSPHQILAQSIAEGIQSAPATIIQRSCDQIHLFFSYLLDLPFQHSFPFTQPDPEELKNDKEFIKRKNIYINGGFNPYLEQVGIFFGLLRDSLFGPIFKSFLLIMDQIQTEVPQMETSQHQLLTEIAQLTRYKDFFVTAYGRGVQQFLRSLNSFTLIEEIKKVQLPLPPSRQLLDRVMNDFNLQIDPTILETTSVSSKDGLELLGINIEQLNKKTSLELIQLLQAKLSETVKTIFEKFNMKGQKEILDIKQQEEKTITNDINLRRTTQIHITEKIILPVLVPLTSIMPPPLPDGSIQSPRPHLGLPDNLLQDNLLWWLFLGLKTSDEILVGLQGNITPHRIFQKKYTFKSGGPESLWNVFFNTDPYALQTIANRVRSRRDRFRPRYQEALSKYRTLPEEFRNIRFGQMGRKYGGQYQHNNNRGQQNNISQQTKALFSAALNRYRANLENATQFNATEVNRIEDEVNVLRNDFLSPQVSLPTNMRLFIENLKSHNKVTNSIYSNVQHTTTVDTLVSTLTLFAVYLPPNDVQFPCLSIICPILFFWLHVQKSIYVDYAKLISQEPVMPWYQFLSSLPYFNHFKQLIPPPEFERVHRQTDEVCGRYQFLADQDKQYQNFQDAHYFHFTQELSNIQKQGENNLQQQQFPGFRAQTSPINVLAGNIDRHQQQQQQQQQPQQDDKSQTQPQQQQATPLQGQWAQRQQEQQPQQPTQQHQQHQQHPQRQQRQYQQRDGQQQQQHRQYQPRDGQQQQHQGQHDGQQQQHQNQRPNNYNNNNNNNQQRDGQYNNQNRKNNHPQQSQNRGPKTVTAVQPATTAAVSAQAVSAQAVSAQPVSAQPVPAPKKTQ